MVVRLRALGLTLKLVNLTNYKFRFWVVRQRKKKLIIEEYTKGEAEVFASLEFIKL